MLACEHVCVHVCKVMINVNNGTLMLQIMCVLVCT